MADPSDVIGNQRVRLAVNDRLILRRQSGSQSWWEQEMVVVEVRPDGTVRLVAV